MENAILVLHLSLGITYLFTAYYIYKDPVTWGKKIKPWARNLLPVNPISAMYATALFDAVLGIWLLSGLFLWVAAILSILHILQVFIAAGVQGPHYRDISVLGASIALFLLVS